MLTKLSIQNFRSIKALNTALDKHLTCIVGESYQGKSNILRSIKWVMLNRPSGARMIRWGRKNCRVSIEHKGHTVERKKGTSENSYTVDDLVLKAFGNNIPDKVQKIFPVSEINFQSQQEMPPGEGPLFWFALSPGQISKKINQIVNLDIIDRTLSNIQSRVRSVKAEIQVCRDRKRQAKEKVESLQYVEQLTSEWKKVVELKEKADKIPAQIELLELLLADIQEQFEALKTTGSCIALMEKELKDVEKINASIQSHEVKLHFLEELVEEIISIQQLIRKLNKEIIIKEKQYIESRGSECPLCGSPLTNP